MSTYAIGDIQGCYKDLRNTLDSVNFNPSKDTLWLTGDLVARGPKSLKTLRYLFSIRDSIITVLGNHDLHLLALAHTTKRKNLHQISKDIRPILKADDRIDLLEWLLHQPIAYYDSRLNTFMSHAGVYPQWSLKKAYKYAFELEEVLQDESQRLQYFNNMYGNYPNFWSKQLDGHERLRFITNAFTRMRYVTKRCRINLKNKSKLKDKPKTFIPWFRYPKRKLLDSRIIFGHWAALGYHQEDNVLCLDSGCVWGNELTIVKIKPYKHK